MCADALNIAREHGSPALTIAESMSAGLGAELTVPRPGVVHCYETTAHSTAVLRRPLGRAALRAVGAVRADLRRFGRNLRPRRTAALVGSDQPDDSEIRLGSRPAGDLNRALLVLDAPAESDRRQWGNDDCMEPVTTPEPMRRVAAAENVAALEISDVVSASAEDAGRAVVTMRLLHGLLRFPFGEAPTRASHAGSHGGHAHADRRMTDAPRSGERGGGGDLVGALPAGPRHHLKQARRFRRSVGVNDPATLDVAPRASERSGCCGSTSSCRHLSGRGRGACRRRIAAGAFPPS